MERVRTTVSLLRSRADLGGICIIAATLSAYLAFSLEAAIFLIIGIILGNFIPKDVAAFLCSVAASLFFACGIALGVCIAMHSYYTEESTQIVCSELSNSIPNTWAQVIAGVSMTLLGVGLMTYVPTLYRFLRRDAIHLEQQHPPTSIAPMGYFTIDEWTAWEQYDKILADHEVRAFRSYLMNYHDSKFYDYWTPKIQTLAAVLLLLGIIAFTFGFSLPEPGLSEFVKYIPKITLPTGSLFALISSGPSFLFPAWATRGQKHIEAGSKWLHIHRNANVRRLQLRQMPANFLKKDEVAGWCDGLAAQYYEASKITVPSETTYTMFEDYNKVKETMDKRRRFRQVFMNDTENSDETRNRNGRVQGRPPIH